MSDAALLTAEPQALFTSLDHIRAELQRLDRSRQPSGLRTANRLRIELRQRADDATAGGVLLRLPHLARTFRLTPFEHDIVLLALAPELDSRRPPATIEAALTALCETDHERLQARCAFQPHASLRRHRLVEPAGQTRALKQRLRLDARIADFLLDGDHLDARLTTGPPVAHWVTPRVRFADLVLPAGIETAAAAAGRRTTCLLDGPAGSGKQSAAEASCTAASRPLLVVDVTAALRQDDVPFELLFELALREARLYGAAIYVEGWDDLLQADPRVQRACAAAQHALAGFDGPAFIGSEQPWKPALLSAWIRASIPPPGEAMRLEAWRRALDGHPGAEPIDTALLARAFHLTPGRIVRAVRSQSGRGSITMSGLLAACRAEAGEHLIAFAKPSAPTRDWDDLVLPRDTAAQLRELCDQATHRQRVLGEWGFGARLHLGKGLIALFTGPSGTGKTLSAHVIARSLGLDLYRIDLSAVTSKFIGETEKNVNRIFDDAERSSAVLLFDEADSLFGKRTDVRDAHDRYANAEVNFLLQRIEEYEGIVLLASNMSGNIDPAFLRRMQFVVEFPFPEEDQRARIWRRLFPPDAPRAADVDVDFLARTFKLTGGSIRNVVLAAAYRAAAAGAAIGMEHIVLALKREYQRQGKVCDRAEFGRYYELVR